MKAIMVMYDSLRRNMLPSYGCDWVIAPNFQRLAENTVTFDNAYVGSMPCMPARRELHTGRYNFLHRSWGPIEPFDDSTPEILKQNGVHTHLVSDHYHYWEEGGCNYHTRYATWENSRGQEGDPWKGVVGGVEQLGNFSDRGVLGNQDWVNREHMLEIKDQPQAVTFSLGLEFLERNHDADNWLLQIETFDPHEPYYAHQKYKDLYPHDYDGPLWDWPSYGRVSESPEAIRHMRMENAALVSMCDEHLGKVLDFMDSHDMWKDTMLIVNTDHGFLLGEHDWWGKCLMPFYNEVANMPLFVWDPRSGKRGERRKSLVQTIDIPATLLELFGMELPADMEGKPLRRTVENDQPVRKAGLFGVCGGHVNVTDGRYVYMRAPVRKDNTPLFEHTLMPTHMRHTFGVEEFEDMTLAEPFSFTKGCRTMKIAGRTRRSPHDFGTLLFDTERDSDQQSPIQDASVEARMIELLIELMRANDAPAEQYERLGLPRP